MIFKAILINCKILSKIDYMAIFGKAFWLNYTTGEEIILREGNNWDVFLNYFFAVFFIFCFVIGILLDPFIIAYHAQQKRTFAKFLFLLVSSMDLFKSLYFPLVLVPKLLSPLGEDDYYYNWDLTNVPWTSHLNKVLVLLSMYEIDVLVVLCIVRYNSVVNPLSSSRVRNIVLSSILILSFLLNIFAGFMDYFYEPLVYYKIIDVLISSDQKYLSNVLHPMSCFIFSANCLLFLFGGMYTILTIKYLRNSDTATSETSRINIRKGIISLVAMSLFNILLILSNLGHGFDLMLKANSKIETYSTMSDFIAFSNIFFTPVIQSAFNAVSFLTICSTFRIFVMKSVCRRTENVNPSVNLSTIATSN